MRTRRTTNNPLQTKERRGDARSWTYSLTEAQEQLEKRRSLKNVDAIDNVSLITNSLRHMTFERSLPAPSYFRLAREAHLVLYRSMIEALKGTANLTVTEQLPSSPSFRYQQGRDPWREIHKEPVTGCKKAWRFSAPAPCEPPNPDLPRAEEPGNRLIGFYDALAMIQADCFMGQLVQSKPVPVDDESMATLEWLHEAIRNEYEHFIPRYYAAPVKDLVTAVELCLCVSRRLLFDSFNVCLDPSHRQAIVELLASLESGPGRELM